MAKMECDKDMEIPIIDEYIKIMSEAEGKDVKVEYVERFEFYERAKKCYAVIATGFVLSVCVMARETSQYANIILQKGVIKNPEYCRFCSIHVLLLLLHPLLFLFKDRKSELDAHLENYGFVPFPAQKTNGIWQPLPLGVDFFHLHLRGLYERFARCTVAIIDSSSFSFLRY